MNYLKYSTIALAAILCQSCADEAPYLAGTLNPTIDIETTSTTAEITINLAKSVELFKEIDNCYCSVHIDGLNKSQQFQIKSNGQMMLVPVGTATFTGLTPNTSYTFYLEVSSPFGSSNISSGNIAYCSDEFTFTTKPQNI